MWILSLKMEWSDRSIIVRLNREIFSKREYFYLIKPITDDRLPTTHSLTDDDNVDNWKFSDWPTDRPTYQPTDQFSEHPSPFIYHGVVRMMVHHIVWSGHVHQSCQKVRCQRSQVHRAMAPRRQFSLLYRLQLQRRLRPHLPLQVAGKSQW